MKKIDLDYTPECLKECNRHCVPKNEKYITKNVIKNIFKLKTKIFKKIEKIKYYIIYSNCYSEMEYYGISSFNCCEGSIEIFCSECPYFYKNKQIEHRK